MEWETELPDGVEVGDSGHADIHNAALDGIRELRYLVETLQGEISNLESQVSALESRVDDLENGNGG